MLLSMLPSEVLAYFAGPPTAGITITDTDGNRVTADESWNEVFPYGTFAFANSQVTVEEGGESVRVSVYRVFCKLIFPVFAHSVCSSLPGNFMVDFSSANS
jgi:hypothetical protein